MDRKQLKFDPTSWTEEEIRDFQEGCESEGSYHGNDPKVIAKIQDEMERDEEFQRFLKWSEEIDNKDEFEQSDK